MKIKEGFVLKTVGDNHIVVPVGAQTVDFRSMITLNETGAFLWKMLENGCEEADLQKELLAEYAVEADLAQRDIAAFIAKLTENNLLEA